MGIGGDVGGSGWEEKMWEEVYIMKGPRRIWEWHSDGVLEWEYQLCFVGLGMRPEGHSLLSDICSSYVYDKSIRR